MGVMVGAAVGVGEGTGVGLGVAVGVGEGTGVGLGVGVGVGEGTGVGLGVAVEVGEETGVGLGIAVGVGEEVGVGLGVGVGVGEGAGVWLTVAVEVGETVEVGTAVAVGDTVGSAGVGSSTPIGWKVTSTSARDGGMLIGSPIWLGCFPVRCNVISSREPTVTAVAAVISPLTLGLRLAACACSMRRS